MVPLFPPCSVGTSGIASCGISVTLPAALESFIWIHSPPRVASRLRSCAYPVAKHESSGGIAVTRASIQVTPTIRPRFSHQKQKTDLLRRRYVPPAATRLSLGPPRSQIGSPSLEHQYKSLLLFDRVSAIKNKKPTCCGAVTSRPRQLGYL